MIKAAQLQPDTNILVEIKAHLEAQKKRVYTEIRNTPMPIPGCDAQYNFLLEERARINQELKQLSVLSEDPLDSAGFVGTMRDFIEASHYIDPQVRCELNAALDATSGYLNSD